jgi:hypothetical protein
LLRQIEIDRTPKDAIMISVIEPFGGLGNWMRALDSAIALSTRIHHDLAVIWYQDTTFNCNFEELLTIPQTIKTLIQIDLNNELAHFIESIHGNTSPAFATGCIDQESIDELLGKNTNSQNLLRFGESIL